MTRCSSNNHSGSSLISKLKIAHFKSPIHSNNLFSSISQSNSTNLSSTNPSLTSPCSSQILSNNNQCNLDNLSLACSSHQHFSTCQHPNRKMRRTKKMRTIMIMKQRQHCKMKMTYKDCRNVVCLRQTACRNLRKKQHLSLMWRHICSSERSLTRKNSSKMIQVMMR